MMKKIAPICLALLLAKTVLPAEVILHRDLAWSQKTNYRLNNVTYPYYITFRGAGTNEPQYKYLPIFSVSCLATGDKNVKVFLKNEVYLPMDHSVRFQSHELVKDRKVPVSFTIGYERGRPKVGIQVLPLRVASNGGFEKLVSFDIVVVSDESPRNIEVFGKRSFSTASVLRQGVWHKIAVTQTGIHKLDSTFFKRNHISTQGIDPRTIKIYGNGAGMLPQLNAKFRHDDLVENAIWIKGETDGKLDPEDYILFYAEAQFDQWQYDTASKRYAHQPNVYCDTTYYFVTFGGATGKRVATQAATLTPNQQTNQFDQHVVHEVDRVNLLASGKLWLGEEFDKLPQQNFTVQMGDVNTAEPLFLRSAVYARSFTPSNMYVSVNGASAITHSVDYVIPHFESTFVKRDFADPKTALVPASSVVNVAYSYNQPLAGSTAWLDYFELQCRNNLRMAGSQLVFRDSKTVAPGNITRFDIGGDPASLRVWELADKLHPVELILSGTGTASIVTTTDSLKEFVAFDSREFFTPAYIGGVSNQNLHGIPATDYVIVTHPQFVNEANELAGLYSGKLRTRVVTIDEVYNEFSSGAEDICAIRDFMRMLYSRASVPADMPRYLLLFGRGSYDYKHRIPGNTDFIPTYESVESSHPVISYCSDDFFGFLDVNEGTWDGPGDYGIKTDFLDVGIGRLPAQDNAQAQVMVNKIKAYSTSAGFGDWRNKLVFVADGGEDGHWFVGQSESMDDLIRQKCRNYNIEKIYADAFKTVEEAGGARSPDAQAQIVRSVEKGAMLVDYTGHGGPVGLSAERILNTDDIRGWTNGLKLPLFVTATCEFSRFDEPSRTSAGELILLNANGGGIALFSTVRLTGLTSNSTLNEIFFDYAGFDSASAHHRLNLGDIMRLTKNDYTIADKNERNFTLLGDPAMMLAYPDYRVKTTSINKKPLTAVPDTMKAFAKVYVEGIVTDINGIPVPNFNGIVYPTVYDKPQVYTTLGNVAGSGTEAFEMQNNAIYRGKATVKNDSFSFSFVVPKDISYQNGFGKISYYANNSSTDAHGYSDGFIVGGTSDSVASDKNGPQISLFMNDEHFVNWGTTNESPLFIAKLADENGINTVGKGIGRDLSLVISNDQSSKTIAVNDYYQAKLDTYKEGELNYRFKNLPQGNNHAKLRAWDIYNNVSEAGIDFVVATSETMALRHVLNFPNPFTTFTTFHFDHNKAGEAMNVSIQVFTVAGKLIKTLNTEMTAATGHFDQLTWDGRDDYGDPIGKGVYVYKVRVKSATGKSAEEYQKLVILN